MRTAIRATQHHFHDLAGHFLALGSGDRLLRFGSVMTDAQIVAYVESVLGCADTVLIVAEPLRGISGVLHLESMGCGVTLGLSVSARSRGLGIGTLLLQRAELLACARGLGALFVRNLTLNTALQRLALGLGMNVVWEPSALATSLAVPAAAGGDALSKVKITLADDSLRPQWNGFMPGTSLADSTEPVLS